MEIKSKLEYTDLSLLLRDPDFELFETKSYYSNLYYFNIKPDEAPNYIERMQRISENIKLITDKLGLEYLLSEVVQIKELAKISDETYHYSFFFDLYSLACTIEEYMKIQKNDDDPEPETKAASEPLTTTVGLPDELNTEQSRLLFKKAIDEGYIDGSTYKWDYSIRGRKSLLAYFIDKASDYLELRDDSERIPWATFLFLMKDRSDIDYLKGVVSGYNHPEHPKPEPNGFRIIKEWFR